MLWLAVADFKLLVDLAESTYPNEACALLIGRRGLGDDFRVARVEPSRNLASDTRRRFEIDPGLRIGIERELRGASEAAPMRVIGVWHSHPDGPAAPSATDAAMIFEPDLAWAITAVVAGQALFSAAFLPARGGGFRELALRLFEPGGTQG
jgi:proteasome lid subunit RPN8/RPN11